jgi:hypothetical protein
LQHQANAIRLRLPAQQFRIGSNQDAVELLPWLIQVHFFWNWFAPMAQTMKHRILEDWGGGAHCRKAEHVDDVADRQLSRLWRQHPEALALDLQKQVASQMLIFNDAAYSHTMVGAHSR